ncbi:restriction endonuclease subunit S [Bacteroides xylanisolvens]|uniref:restriction endonuclease subunit S n=1 Tax=Bacteroides xylanisolvens TaxID=371601 RepID=UPI00125F46F0|nr:restriction endonuclease subunit S [Bacteroides xylanisolvens]KAB6092389.1 hypothetical protein GA551_09405 [Bacteroides xylanisolvens]
MRFPEFSGEWKKKHLSELVGDIKDRISTSSLSVDNYVSTENILQNFQGVTLATSLPHNTNVTAFRKDDILFSNIRPYLKKIWYASYDGGCSTDVFVFRNSGMCSAMFLYHLIANDKFINYVMLGTKGTKMPRGDKQQIIQYVVYLPSKLEQNKIATFLSLLDSRIEAQIKIIEKYESLIKGIGNKLFSFKMRFKTNDGNDFPSWKTKSFENIGKTFSGLSGKAKEDFGIGKPYIQYKQVFDTPQIQIQNCGLVNVLDSENQNNVKYGDILFTVSSETPDEIGMSSVLLDEVDEMYLNSFCFGYRLSSFEVLNPLYASYFFRDSSFRNKVVKIAQGSTRYNISKSEFIKLKISLPCIEEQARIASFLSAVDEKIKEEKEILALYLIQKNHLLRQMVI